MEIFEVPFYDDDFIKMIARFAINMSVVSLLVTLGYNRKSRSKDYLFTFYTLGTVVFFICFTLKKLELELGMAMGLFAVFGVLRYRTETMPIREMSYLFTVIGLAMVNSLSNLKVSWSELITANTVMALLPAVLENMPLLRQELREEVLYERIDLIQPENYDQLLTDLQERTGLKISRIEIGKIDLLRDVVAITIFYYPHAQQASQVGDVTILRKAKRQ